MWSVPRRGAGAAAWAAGTALLCAAVLAFEARRPAADGDWFRLSAGLGLGSQAGIENGFFGFDARLESLPDAAFGPLPGAALGAGRAGVFTLEPLGR